MPSVAASQNTAGGEAAKLAGFEPPRRLLIRGVNWLGDVIMTLPAICRLREAFPDAHISVLTLPKLADIYRLQPAINSILTLERKNRLWPWRHVYGRSASTPP